MNEQKLLETILTEIVDNADNVTIIKTNDEQGVLYTVEVKKEEAGKLIGKKGETANAIRLILKATGYKYGVHASMKIIAV